MHGRYRYMAHGSQNTLSNPIFEKVRNVSFALRRKLNPCFLSHLFEIRAHTRPDFPVLTFENPSGADIVQTFQDLHENSSEDKGGQACSSDMQFKEQGYLHNG
jgi:hypothetical protein